MRYMEVGPGEPLGSGTYLLLHGLGGSLEHWHEVQTRLGESAYTIAVDIPGFGLSRERGFQFDLPAAADRIAAFVRSRQLTGVTLVSHSIGSAVAGAVAARLAESVSRVIFVSGAMFRAADMAQHPTHFFRNPQLATAVGIQFLSGSIRVTRPIRWALVHSPTFRQIALWPFVAHPRRIDRTILNYALIGAGSPTVLWILIHAESINYGQIIAAVPQPIFLISGAADRLVGPADVAQMRRTVDVVAAHTIPDCGHWPMIEKPAELTEFLRTWGHNGRQQD